MKIIKHSIEELIEKLRTVRIMGFGNPVIYPEPLVIDIDFVWINEIKPCQNYYLEDNVKNITNLRNQILSEHNIDVFSMGMSSNRSVGYIDIELPSGELMPYMPPIVETYLPEKFLVNDGIHRLIAATRAGIEFPDCIVIDKPDWPYYAYPLDAGWDGVQKIEGELPEGFAKKSYRLPTKDLYKQLFRNFNDVFPGVQKDRPKGTVS